MRHRLLGKLGASLSVLCALAGALYVSGTFSAFSGSTANPGNSFAAGTVVLGDNDLGSAMFTMTGLKPGDTATKCLNVTSTGTLPSVVRLYGTTTGSGLDAYLNVVVTRGTISSGSFPSCSGFTADATNHLGLGAGVLYSGTLAAYPDDWTAGIADPKPTLPEAWTTNEIHAYKLAVTLADTDAAQGLTATQAFTWEARNDTSYRGMVLSDNPIGYWRLGDASGATAADSAGANPGTITNVTLGAAGALNGDADTAGSFDGSTSFVAVNLPQVNTAAGASNTVEFWMYWDGNGNRMPFGFPSYDLHFGNGFGFNTAASDLWGIPSTGLANTWVHVAAVFYNGDARQSVLYINGVRQTLTQRAGTTGSRTVSTSANISGWSNGGGGYRFGGRLDEVAVYNYPLSAEQVMAHYNAR